MIGASSWAAEFVTRHPLLLDELLDNRLLQEQPDLAGYESALRDALAHAPEGDVEREMNILREHHQAQVFRLLAQDLAGLLTVERLADHLSELADRTLNVAIGEAWQQVRTRHRDTPRFAVIAYGKLGGKELGYASDLDMIFLYDDDDERAQENYLRLAQRLNNLLSQRSSSGILFETDLQLRPSGQKGLLVSQLEAFSKYQDESAWVWEHQALTRARFCAGDAQLGEAFEAIRVRILTRSRDTCFARERSACDAREDARRAPEQERPVRSEARPRRNDRRRIHRPVPRARVLEQARRTHRKPRQHRSAEDRR
jgi:glutamate-ammonia-ligase adenylyltransferase